MMKFYDKLVGLRREKGFSQEQLADLLGVSRQAVSKWESGSSMPETEKLIAIADLFGVSVDYLVRENVEQREQSKTVVTTQDNVAVMEELAEIKKRLHKPQGRWGYEYEYKSKRCIGKIPLVHIHMTNGGFTPAVGIIAIGNTALGVVSIGGLSAGLLSIGGLSAGLVFALGGLAAGGFAVGGVAIGAVAVGGLAIGSLYAVGGAAFAKELAVGGGAVGRVAIGAAAQGDHALAIPEGTRNADEMIRAFALEHARMPQFLRAMLGG